jgi:hypothetical protein
MLNRGVTIARHCIGASTPSQKMGGKIGTEINNTTQQIIISVF